jgi:uncharacterized protein YjiS (DUF1127 family)
MSIQFRFPPAFPKHNYIKLFDAQDAEHVERKGKSDKPVARKSPLAPLREGHIILLVIDVLVTLHAAFRKWRNHRRTLRALEELDEHQLADIGLRREQVSYSHFGYRPLAGADAPKRTSTTVVGSATPSCCERKTETYRPKIRQRLIPDHTHTNPEYVWGDEGPITERKETS